MNKVSLSFICAFLMAAAATAAPVTPYEAGRFVDSVGVNIQLGGQSPGYADHTRVQSNLQYMGIRHVRNPLWGNPPPYATYNKLASVGIHLIVPTGYNHDGQGVEVLASQLHNIRGAVEGVEGINEPDIFPPHPTAQQVFDYQKALYNRIKADPLLTHIPVLAPSIGNPYSNNIGQQLTDLNLGQFADIANSHAYQAIWMPENHSWVTNMVNWASTMVPGKPQIMTETGYGWDHVTDEIAGIYTPRLLLDLFLRGLQRSYIYQLVDIGDGFGGLYKSDGITIRPQGRSVRNLILVLDDGIKTFPTETVPFDFTLSGETADLKSALFQKRNGDYLLALWRAYEATDNAQPIATLTLNTPATPTRSKVFTNLDSETFNPNGDELILTDKRADLPVGTRVVIVELSGLSTPLASIKTDFRLYE